MIIKGNKLSLCLRAEKCQTVEYIDPLKRIVVRQQISEFS